MALDQEVAALAAIHHGVFSTAVLDELRASKHERQWRVDTGRWTRVYDGVFRIAGAPITWRGEVLAACWAGGTRAVASHRTAAALWDLPGGDSTTIEVSCPRWRRARHAGLVVHESTRLDQIDIAEVDGIPCTAIERTIFDMCGLGGPGMADLLFDSALRRNLTTIPRLVNTRDRLARRGRRGATRFRAALESRDPVAAVPDSAPERMLARYLVGQGLPNPAFQYEVHDADGRFVARTDLAYPDARVLVEYDSYLHHSGKVALDRDSARRNRLVGLRYSVITATPADLRDRAHRLSRVLAPLLEAVS